jgi:hypothetical protein
MATNTNFHVLSVLERRHIVETVQDTIRLLDDDGISDAAMFLTDELREILRILGADNDEK